MNEIATVGLDLAKNTFHVIGCNVHGKEVKRKMLRRSQVMAYFANLPVTNCNHPAFEPQSSRFLDHIN